MKKCLVTGSSGLIGSEVVASFSAEGWEVHGVDNNMRRDFFGPPGGHRLESKAPRKRVPKIPRHREVDIRDRQRVIETVREIEPDAIIHTAAQPEP